MARECSISLDTRVQMMPYCLTIDEVDSDRSPQEHL